MQEELLPYAPQLSGAGCKEVAVGSMCGEICLRQGVASLHMTDLDRLLTNRDTSAVCAAEYAMSGSRAAVRRVDADLCNTRLRVVSDIVRSKALVHDASPSSIHIRQDLRRNGMSGAARSVLAMRSQRRWVVMETVNDLGWKGRPRRLDYRGLPLKERYRLAGKLVSGGAIPDLLMARGMPRLSVLTFACSPPETPVLDPVRKGYCPVEVRPVGQLTHCKRYDLLIDAVPELARGSADFAIVDSETVESELRKRGRGADLSLRWLTYRPKVFVCCIMAQTGSLVFLTRHEGGGAAIPEARRCVRPRFVLKREALPWSCARAARAMLSPHVRCSQGAISLSRSRSGKPT